MIAFLCHRLPERSFLWLWDPPWLCARCTGFYGALVLGVIVCLLYSNLLRLRLRWGIGLATISLVAIGGEKLGSLDLGNEIRCLTAIPLGFVVGAGLVIPLHTLLYNKKNRTL